MMKKPMVPMSAPTGPGVAGPPASITPHQSHARSKGFAANVQDHQANAMGYAGGGAVCYDKHVEGMCSGGKVK